MNHPVLLVVGVLGGYALVMRTNPVRHSLRDGLRCVARYPQIWLLPATFALVHAGFRLWQREYEAGLLAGGTNSALLPWSGWQPPPWTEAIAASRLPTAESTAAIFNCAVTTFPLSALAAALFLGNWRGYQWSLFGGLVRRFGVFGSVAIHGGLVLSALAALFKPVLFVGLPGLNGYFGAAVLLRVGGGVDALSFVFEYLLGVGVQIYLVLLSFAWVRGLTFDFDALRRFALRRFAHVVKWAMVVIAISTAGISLPLAFSAFAQRADAGGADWLGETIWTTRWLLSTMLIVFCSMQIHLIFHNESLARAWKEHFRLLWRHGVHVGWLVVVAALHFFMLGVMDAFLPVAMGARSWPAAGWNVVAYPILWTALAGWFVASWVCLFRRCERNQPNADELVNY